MSFNAWIHFSTNVSSIYRMCKYPKILNRLKDIISIIFYTQKYQVELKNVKNRIRVFKPEFQNQVSKSKPKIGHFQVYFNKPIKLPRGCTK